MIAITAIRTYHNSVWRGCNCKWVGMSLLVVLSFLQPSMSQADSRPQLQYRESGRAVYLIKGSKRLLVKRVEGGEEIQAAKLLNSTTVFVAYSYYSSGPGTTISIVTIEPHSEWVVGDLGGTQDIVFAFNSTNHSVAFNKGNHIYMLDTDSVLAIPRTANVLDEFNKLLSIAFTCQYLCGAPSWTNSSTISFVDRGQNGPDSKQSIRISE